ncbi:hypothetical protein [Nonomuraea africana]|uniref:Nucleic acid-binding protein n=1 Tax=Nonomuraea africana TaxID=46171 RepID=A0ABR9KDM9_9ACTN|nr:hypothetical protein [Nonomuraea africana]MBE1560105.1 putative nucleic acid-binding protein [Nonomuraea africana]
MTIHSPTPYILDTGVLIEIARGDSDLIGLVQGYDAIGQPMVVPALAITGASLDVRSDEADDLLAGLDLLPEVTIAPLNGAEQASARARKAGRSIMSGVSRTSGPRPLSGTAGRSVSDALAAKSVTQLATWARFSTGNTVEIGTDSSSLIAERTAWFGTDQAACSPSRSLAASGRRRRSASSSRMARVSIQVLAVGDQVQNKP